MPPPSKTATVKPLNAPAEPQPTEAEKEQKAKLKRQAAELTGQTPDIKEKLTHLLGAYCLGDVDRMQTVLKEVSLFKGKDGEEIWIKDIEKAKEKWCQTSYGKLKKLMSDKSGIPEDCDGSPDACSHSSWADGLAYCGETPCPLQPEVKF